MIKAIIIDDESHCRKTLMMMLKDYCPEVNVIEEIGEPESGLVAIQKLSPDLLFLDIEMPNMNGFEVLKKSLRLISILSSPPVTIAML